MDRLRAIAVEEIALEGPCGEQQAASCRAGTAAQAYPGATQGEGILTIADVHAPLTAALPTHPLLVSVTGHGSVWDKASPRLRPFDGPPPSAPFPS